MTTDSSFRCPHCGQLHPSGTVYCPINGLPIETTTEAVTNPVMEFLRPFMTRGWIIAGVVVAGLILCLAAFVTLSILRGRVNPSATPTMTIILPTSTTAPGMPSATPGGVILTPTNSPSATPDSEAWDACPGAAYQSRLHVGDTAEVSNDPPLANRIRTDASLDADVLGYIQPGEDAVILDGPRCTNNWVWWEVRSEASGLEGWTAEGDEDSYWLVPVGN